MTLYGLTLLLVLLGLLVAALDVILFAVSPWLLPLLTGIAPPRRANAVLLARFMPVGVSFLLTAFVFLPAWWRQEPSNTGETVSPCSPWLCLPSCPFSMVFIAPHECF